MQIASAMPRRRVNHCEVSAANGANVAETPSRPISTPCTMPNCHRLVAELAPKKPAPSPSVPTTIGTMTPNRSARRPISTPPTPKPISVNV